MRLSPNTATNLQWSQFTQAIRSYRQLNGAQAVRAANRLASIGWNGSAQIQLNVSINLNQLPVCGCLPAPRLEYAGAPAGQGLSKDPEGFPKGSIRTAGGYTVVPGRQDVKIFGPGKKSTDGPDTHIWGDPHVNEKDGTRWDFTRNSNFRLPDGTLIDVRTTAQTGASVTKGITVVNGADRVDVTNMVHQPEVSDIRQDGYEWRSHHLSTKRNQDTFVLGGDSKAIHWFKEKNGVLEGEVTGARVGKDGAFEQILDKGKRFYVAPELRPTLGSTAWGNQLRSRLTGIIARSSGQDSWKSQFASFMSVDHRMAALASSAQPFIPMFGGLALSFPNLQGVFGAISGLGNQMLSYDALSNQLRWPLVSA